MRSRYVWCAAAVILALIAGGCSGMTQLERFRSSPDRYMGEPITLFGEIVDTKHSRIAQYEFFELDGPDGKVWVVTRGDVPLKGLHFRVKGIFKRVPSDAVGAGVGEFVVQEYERTPVEAPGESGGYRVEPGL